jgi:hypothetical protein
MGRSGPSTTGPTADIPHACWLNRDPIEEKGGLNLYGLVHNTPINLVDSDGRGALPILLPILAAVIWADICRDLAIQNGQATFPEDDKKQHCFSACSFNRCMLSAPGLTALGALWQEISSGQIFTDPREAIEDIKAGLYGIASSYSFKTCKTKCEACPVKNE